MAFSGSQLGGVRAIGIMREAYGSFANKEQAAEVAVPKHEGFTRNVGRLMN